MTYGLMNNTTRGHYEEASSRYEYILGTDEDKEELIRRYNNWEGRKCELDEDGDGSYPGNTGGGCSYVSNSLSIKILDEFDKDG